jgi:hypothetical protein
MAGVNPLSSTGFFLLVFSDPEEGGARQTARTSSGSKKPAIAIIYQNVSEVSCYPPFLNQKRTLAI